MLCSFGVIYDNLHSEDIDPFTLVKLRQVLSLKLCDDIKQSNAHYDFVVPIPRTGHLYSHSISNELNIAHVDIFKKSSSVRSTGLPNSVRLSINRTLDIESGLSVNGKKLLIVDEACATGQTAKIISQLALSHGARSVGFAFVAPFVLAHCPFGKVFRDYLYPYATKTAAERSLEMKTYLKADNVFTNSFEAFKMIFSAHNTCFSCFQDGGYNDNKRSD